LQNQKDTKRISRKAVDVDLRHLHSVMDILSREQEFENAQNVDFQKLKILFTFQACYQ